VVNLPDDQDPHELDARAAPALRTAILIRDREGSVALGPFYAALGRRIWEEPPPSGDMAKAVRESLVEIGLDESLCDEALDDPSTWQAVLDEHHALVERTGAFGVPTLVLDDGAGPAIFGPVVSQLPSDEDTVALWQHLSWLTRYTNFAELKRSRATPPDLPTAAWYREQRDKERAQAS